MYTVERRTGHIEGGRWAKLEKLASYDVREDAEGFAETQLSGPDWVETFTDDLKVVRIWINVPLDSLIRIYTTGDAT